LKSKIVSLPENSRVGVAVGDNQLVILGLGHGGDLAVGIDDDAARDQRVAILDAALRHRHDPGRILIGAGLEREAM